jgi:hypothetical protein
MGGVGIAAGGGAIGLPLLIILAPAGYFAGQELDSEGYTKKVVALFEALLQEAQKLDYEHYAGVVANKFTQLLARIRDLEPEGRRYTDGIVDTFKRLLGKTGNAPS